MAYDPPTPANLKLRYAAFEPVADERMQYWLTDAERIVTTAWREADYAPGLMALAAHNMALAAVPGLVIDGVAAVARKGVTAFRSASFSASFDADTAERLSAGGYSATEYGVEFAAMLRRNVGGPRLVGCANVC